MNKGNRFTSQFQLLHSFLFKHTTSAKMASVQTGIPIEAICWYKRHMRKVGKVSVVNIQPCPITGQMVEFLTTDPEKFPPEKQLRLWE